MELAIDIEELSSVPQAHNTGAEDLEIVSDKATIETIESFLQPYKKQDGKYDYENINSDDLKKLQASYSLLHWLDQIKVKLLHQDLKSFLYPHLEDSFGYKFTRKNHQATKGKMTVYYYCEAYKDCPVGIKLTFSDDLKKFIKVICFCTIQSLTLGNTLKRTKS